MAPRVPQTVARASALLRRLESLQPGCRCRRLCWQSGFRLPPPPGALLSPGLRWREGSPSASCAESLLRRRCSQQTRRPTEPLLPRGAWTGARSRQSPALQAGCADPRPGDPPAWVPRERGWLPLSAVPVGARTLGGRRSSPTDQASHATMSAFVCRSCSCHCIRLCSHSADSCRTSCRGQGRSSRQGQSQLLEGLPSALTHVAASLPQPVGRQRFAPTTTRQSRYLQHFLAALRGWKTCGWPGWRSWLPPALLLRPGGAAWTWPEHTANRQQEELVSAQSRLVSHFHLVSELPRLPEEAGEGGSLPMARGSPLRLDRAAPPLCCKGQHRDAGRTLPLPPAPLSGL